jgi:hypothetical protein
MSVPVGLGCGNADEFFIVAEDAKSDGTPAVRTTVHLTHEEMIHLLADYRQNHPMNGGSYSHQLSGPAKSRVGDLLANLLKSRR